MRCSTALEGDDEQMEMHLDLMTYGISAHDMYAYMLIIIYTRAYVNQRWSVPA